jgi:hypothetical protein
MSNRLKTHLSVLILLAAPAAHADLLTYSNAVAALSGNPPAPVGFSIPQFDPAKGTLNSVAVTISSRGLSRFSWDGWLASGQFTVWEDNLLSFLYNGSNVLAQNEFLLMSPGYPNGFPLPSAGQTVSVAHPATNQVTFSAASDLANFIGTGDIPLSAEYYSQPVVTVTGGLITWTFDNSSTMTAVVTYDFSAVPEPGLAGLFFAGALLFTLRKSR